MNAGSGARGVCLLYARVTLIPLSASSRPLEANTGIGLSLSLFETIRPLCAANSEAFSMPSRGGGTSLDQAMLTKTLRPSDIGTGPWVCSSRWSTLDFMQKPGEGEMLTVTFEAMMTSFDSSSPDRPPPRVLSWANNRKRESQNPRLPSGVSHRVKHLFSPSHALSPPLESFNIDADMARTYAEAQTPLPNIDDDLSMQKYISDRRVIGVMVLPSTHSCSHYMRPV
jgi:hypothetical protein